MPRVRRMEMTRGIKLQGKKKKKKMAMVQLLSPVQILIFTWGTRKSKNVVILIQTSVRRDHEKGLRNFFNIERT